MAEKSRPDPEFLAMRSIVRTLSKLPQTARQRVLGYAAERIRQEPQLRYTDAGTQGAQQHSDLVLRRSNTDPLFANAAQAAGSLLG